jgi:teichuronic acid biosynthesis glycosyltransferase TuaG
MPVVTVLTAVRNGARFLPETIASIRSQTFGDWEHVIVDDASEDDTAQIVESAMRTDPRVKLVRRAERGGPYAAANEGLSSARGHYVARIDADDVALPPRIERQVSFLQQTGLRACATSWQGQTDEGVRTPEVARVAGGRGSIKWRLCLRQGLAHSTACVERGALEEIGRYRELLVAQDLRMWCDLARREWLDVIPEVLVLVRRPGGLTASTVEMQERLALDVLRDHLGELSSSPWSDEEVLALRPQWTGQPVWVRLDALKRWGALWRSDAALQPGERRELKRLERGAGWHVTRQALRREGLSVDTLRAFISSPPARSGSS